MQSWSERHPRSRPKWYKKIDMMLHEGSAKNNRLCTSFDSHGVHTKLHLDDHKAMRQSKRARMEII